MKPLLQELGKSLGRYLSRQKPEVVLLFCLVGLTAAGLYALPGLLSKQADRFERVVDKVCAAFETDQSRDQDRAKADRERDQQTILRLLDRVAADDAAEPDKLVARP